VSCYGTEGGCELSDGERLTGAVHGKQNKTRKWPARERQVRGSEIEPETLSARVKTKQKLNMKKLQLAAMAAALTVAIQANATMTYELTFTATDGSGITGLGSVKAEPNGDGSFTAVSGSFSITGGGFMGATGALVPNPHPPSPWDQVVYNGTIFGGVDNQLFPSTPELIPNAVMFNDKSFPITGVWGSGNGLAFALWGSGIAFNGYADQPWFEVHVGVTTLSAAVPEPTTCIAGALLLLPFGVSTLRGLRRKA